MAEPGCCNYRTQLWGLVAPEGTLLPASPEESSPNSEKQTEIGRK